MRRQLVILFTIAALLSSFLLLPLRPAAANDGVIKQAARGDLKVVTFKAGSVIRRLPSFSAGMLATAREALQSSEPNIVGAATTRAAQPSFGTLGCGNRNTGGNIRVNQDCTYRRQAEESITFNPTNPRNLVAGQNDSRIGFNHCGFDYSFNSGVSWGDGLPPFFQHLNDPATTGVTHTILGGPGTLHTYDAASDPGVTFDSQGNAFFSCVVFDVNSNASGLFVTRSPAPAGGSFYNNVPASGEKYVVVEDNNVGVLHDKEFITADANPNSPFRDNVYVTWTVFRFDPRCGGTPAAPAECSSAIYFSRSTDHGVTWSQPMEISGNSPTLCFFGNLFDPARDPHDCDLDQGSDPTVLPNGHIVVIFNNGNTPANDPNAQQLAVVSKDGGVTWSAPSKVGDDVVAGEPLCDFGRGPEECIPGAFIRTNDFPRIAVDSSRGVVYATWQDYRTEQFDIHLSFSVDGGKSWHEAQTPVNPDTTANKDHYEPAIAVSSVFHQVAVSYYRTDRVPDESALAATSAITPFAPGVQAGVQAENSDYTLAGGFAFSTPFAATALTAPFPPPDGIQVGFNGDYSGLTVIGLLAHPIWSDTRNAAMTDQGVMHDEDVFTDVRFIP